MSALNGLDRYSGSDRRVSVEYESAYVSISVEATSGSHTGDALLTPGQARWLAQQLIQAAEAAETGVRSVE
jgi:hypothetical protein